MKQLKFEAVDVEELLTKITNKIVRKNRDYVQIDIETLRKAAKSDTPAYFLWLAHQDGTWCLNEREVYIKGTAANYIWLSFKGKDKAIEATAVTINTLENDRIIGSIYTLNHYEHCKEIQAEIHQALNAEIHYDESHNNMKVCIPMKNYIINDYWNQAITKINYTAKNEQKLMQSITCIRKRQQQNASKDNINNYLNHIEEKLFLNYLWIHDKSKTAKENENMKRKKYDDLKQAGYVFINYEEAFAAKKFSIPFYMIDRRCEMKSTNKNDLDEYWKSGVYLCMDGSWRKLLAFLQDKPVLPYSKNQLQSIVKSARASYNKASEAKKEILSLLIAKITFLLEINRNTPISFMQETGLIHTISDNVTSNVNENDVKEISSINESAFSEKEKKAMYQLLSSNENKYTNKVAESINIRL